MVVYFSQFKWTKRNNDISALRGFKGEIGLFFAVLQKLGHAGFLWWSETLQIKADFERNEIVLRVLGQKKDVSRTISFDDLLSMSKSQLVITHMRPLSAAMARSWELSRTAEVIESGGDRDDIEASVAEELRDRHESPKWYCTALTNILNPDAELPWRDRPYFI